MKEYEDPHTHMSRHIDRAARKYARGLAEAGLEPNEKLTRAMAERAIREAEGRYLQEIGSTSRHNLAVIQDDHRKRMNKIKRDGARLRVWSCSLMVLFFELFAWYSFTHSGTTGVIMGCIYCVGGIAFLLMLILGAIFDRPSR